MAKNGNYESKKFLNFLGFIVTILIAIAILVAGIVLWVKSGHFTLQIPGFGFSNVQTALVCVANILAYVICMVVGFLYAKSKRNVAFIIIDIICIAIIAVVIVLSMFGV